MKTLNLVQGSDEWLQVRKTHFTASEAAAMMGESKHMTRSQLLHTKATGTAKEFSDYVQKNILDKGHQLEELARPIVEQMISEELYPVTGVNEIDELPLLASFDGLNMLWTIGFEHKGWNKELPQTVIDNNIGPDYYWQMEHQLLVSGADHIVFVVSDGTENNFEHLSYHSVPERRKALIAGWKQFQKDLAEYVPTEIKEKPQAEVKKGLPALFLEITGEVKNTNIVQFKQSAETYIAEINTELETDQDFANAEADVKLCKKAEDELEAVKKSALAQTASIEDVMLTIDAVKEKLRQTRLQLDKNVKARKEEIKRREIKRGFELWQEFSENLSQSVGVTLAFTNPDFAGAVKGKRTMSSLIDAIDTTLAKAKIELNELAELYRKNLSLIPAEFEFLFSDKVQILNKPTDDFANLVKSRIADYERQQAEQKAREEAEERAKAEALRQQQELQNQDTAINSETPVLSSAPITQQTTVPATSNAPSAITYEPLDLWPSDYDISQSEELERVCNKLGEAENYILDIEKQLRMARAA